MTIPYTLYICAVLQAFCFSRHEAFQVKYWLPSNLPSSSYQVNHHHRPSEWLSSSLKAKANGDEIPSMDWLTNPLVKKDGTSSSNDLDFDSSPYMEEYDVDEDLGDVPIPTTGVSVTDEMEKANKDRFVTEVVPIIKGLETGVRVAQLVTSATSGSFEPVRYIVGLSKELTKQEEKEALSPELLQLQNTFVMMDVPPYSDQLAANIRAFMGDGGRLAAILVTNREGIHYDEAPSVFITRNADFREWANAFEGIDIVAYRLDIPRDCQEYITQRLDGYGPFALQEDESDSGTNNNTFIETGRPLTYEEWDHDITQDIMTRGKAPPDEEENTALPDEDMYTPEAIRAREEGKRVLAIYTPGHSFGSVSYIFPEIQLCFSGFTVPVEDSREEENMGMESAGPMLDVRGYITTSKAGMTRQMESARQLVETYSDRFTVIMPSRGDPMFLDDDTAERKKGLLELFDQYDKIGKIYEQLGITNFDDDSSF
jgi:hypothetical protein